MLSALDVPICLLLLLLAFASPLNGLLPRTYYPELSTEIRSYQSILATSKVRIRFQPLSSFLSYIFLCISSLHHFQNEILLALLEFLFSQKLTIQFYRLSACYYCTIVPWIIETFFSPILSYIARIFFLSDGFLDQIHLRYISIINFPFNSTLNSSLYS